MKRSIILLLPMLLLATAANAGGVKADIEAANQRFGAAYAKGDASAIAKLYTPGATVFPPGSDLVTGRDGIEKVWAGAIQSGLKFTSLKTISVEQYGHAAREIGRFTAEAPNAQKGTTKLVGKYVVVWKQVGGVWMLDSDIWNLDR